MTTHPENRRAAPNRLAQESSPYLLQHAQNPVDWYPWGPEALERARSEQKPIFLSIGYSACHWCHVMEHESFEDAEIAQLMNDFYINIKVDREERPDLDQIYMTAVQLMTGRGGWPMSVFLTPELKPFFGGTYWPPVASRGMPGFGEILRKVHDVWVHRPSDVQESAERLTSAIQADAVSQTESIPLTAELMQHAEKVLLQRVDWKDGGFGAAPKFPHSMDLRVLLRTWKRFGNPDALKAVTLTLDKMAAGGIYDHLGGGFHRYSTDTRWLAPHFEKMLYDNALLVPAYLEAWQCTQQDQYQTVVRETLDYVLREMTDANGGFYSTQDADSEEEEGKFFVWSKQEIIDVLGPADAPAFLVSYDVSDSGNWEGTNILNRRLSPAASAASLGVTEEELTRSLQRSRDQLLAVRNQRVWPGRDEKILTGWNGLMISAMAQAAQILNEPRYRHAAARAANFLLSSLRPDGRRLLHSYKDGRARFNAYVDDYACLIDGLVDVFQATQESQFVRSALELAEVMIEQFADVDGGGFYYTGHDHETLIARQKDLQDNATPGGNSMAATALLRLSRLTGRRDMEEVAVRTLEFLSSVARKYPAAAGQTLMAIDFWLGPTYEVALVVPATAPDLDDVIRTIHERFIPNKIVAIRELATSPVDPNDELPLLKGKPARGELTTAYICEHGTCGMPQTGVESIVRTLLK